MKAIDIENLIAEKHFKDVVIPQCKTGPSWVNHGLRIMDVWVMPKSWAHSHVTAYEIKVDRQDFISDEKWPEYLAYCNYFYFTCPKDVIRVDEVPKDAGLYYVANTGNRLMLKKKAPYREIVIPEEVFRYILMTRVRITREVELESNKEFWTEWLKEKEECYQLGQRVSKALQCMFKEQVTKVRDENERLLEENKGLQDVKELLRSMNIDPSKTNRWRLTSLFQERASLIGPGGLETTLSRIQQEITRALNILKTGKEY